MALARALLYLAAFALLLLAALNVTSKRVQLALLGWACFVLAFALPDIAAGL